MLSISLGLLLLWIICSPNIEIVTEYAEVEKVVEREVEVIVEVPIELRDFESVEELREWLGEECHFIIFGAKDKVYDCDNHSLWLQKKGLKDGYLVNYEAIMPDEYNKYFKNMEIDGLHAINSVIIGNDFYYIEPQTREIVWRGSLD